MRLAIKLLCGVNPMSAPALGSAALDDAVTFDEFILRRELNEIYLLLDFNSGRIPSSFWEIGDLATSNGNGDVPREIFSPISRNNETIVFSRSASTCEVNFRPYTTINSSSAASRVIRMPAHVAHL